MFSARLMLEILQGFATEADVAAASIDAMAGALPEAAPARSVHDIEDELADLQEIFGAGEVEADYD